MHVRTVRLVDVPLNGFCDLRFVLIGWTWVTVPSMHALPGLDTVEGQVSFVYFAISDLTVAGDRWLLVALGLLLQLLLT